MDNERGGGGRVGRNETRNKRRRTVSFLKYSSGVYQLAMQSVAFLLVLNQV